MRLIVGAGYDILLADLRRQVRRVVAMRCIQADADPWAEIERPPQPHVGRHKPPPVPEEMLISPSYKLVI
jgi:hypothetical protein